MKQLLLKVSLTLGFVSLAAFNLNSYAQENAEILPPIIDLILNDNQAPINFAPAGPLQTAADQSLILLLSASDIDGNLERVQVEASANFGFNLTPSRNPNITFEIIPNGFIITTGSQEDIIPASAVFTPTLVPTLQDNQAEITITSTDSEGAIDTDSFLVNLGISTVGNAAPVNSIQAPFQVDADQVINLRFNVTDEDNNLSSIMLTSSLSASLSPVILSNNVNIQNINNGFIITGTQEDLMDAIRTVSFLPFIGNGNTHTITIVSTDSEGASAQNIANIVVNGSPIIVIQ